MYQSRDAEGWSDRRELAGVIASTVFHAVVLVLLSMLFLAADPAGNRIETATGFADGLPEAVTVIDTEQPLVEPVPPSGSLFEQTSESVTTLLPVPSSDLTPQGLGGDTNEPPAVPSVAAGIQKRVQAAGGKTGEVQFSLSWHDHNDLDLHVIVPRGRRIFYGARRSSCGGELDVDMNVKPESAEPVENTRWLQGRALSGRYTVIVRWYRQHVRARTVPFELLAKLGPQTEVLEGSVQRWGDIVVFRFRYIRPGAGSARRRTLEARYRQLQIDEERVAGQMLKEATATQPYDIPKLATIVVRYPHTDAAIEALQKLPGKSSK